MLKHTHTQNNKHTKHKMKTWKWRPNIETENFCFEVFVLSALCVSMVFRTFSLFLMGGDCVYVLWDFASWYTHWSISANIVFGQENWRVYISIYINLCVCVFVFCENKNISAKNINRENQMRVLFKRTQSFVYHGWENIFLYFIESCLSE